MSACISSRGEFSSHTLLGRDLICDDCGAFDEDGAMSRLAAVEAERDSLKRGYDKAVEQVESEMDQRIAVERQLADLRATETVLRGEIRRTEYALATFDDVVTERDGLRSRLAAITAATDDAAHHLGHAHPVVVALREALGAS